jgi:hypothetical protein
MARISLLIDSPLRDMLLAVRGVPADVRSQINSRTKAAAEPIWFEETRSRAVTRLQHRALVNSARVGVTARNVFLRSGAVGRLSSGAPVSVIANPAEFGGNASATVQTRSRKGTPYKRRLGGGFGSPAKSGKVVYPAARESISRIASLWIQTARRSLFDALDLKGK